MKTLIRLLALVAALSVGWAANAQSSLAGYDFVTSTSANKWLALSSTTNLLTSSGDGVASSVQNIGFSFPFGGSTYTQFSVNSDGSITGDVGILPTDAMSTMTVILVNMAVNGIPTQYLLPLYSLIFHHGHSYNLNLEIGLDGDIRVMSWANQAWTGDVDFN